MTGSSYEADDYIAIDIETTGLNPKTDKMIEIGAVKVIKGQITETFSTLVNPRRQLEEGIIQLTGIDDGMVADAPWVEEAIEKTAVFCGGFPLLGHHISFDYSFLKKAAVNAGITFEKEGIDTLALCRRFMPREEKKNLEAACRFYQIKPAGCHRALWDALAAHELYQALLQNHGTAAPEAFKSQNLIYKVKKEQPATKRQKEGLRELLKYHKIDITVQIDYLTRNEVSRWKDKIISQYGRIVKR